MSFRTFLYSESWSILGKNAVNLPYRKAAASCSVFCRYDAPRPDLTEMQAIHHILCAGLSARFFNRMCIEGLPCHKVPGQVYRFWQERQGGQLSHTRDLRAKNPSNLPYKTEGSRLFLYLLLFFFFSIFNFSARNAVKTALKGIPKTHYYIIKAS